MADGNILTRIVAAKREEVAGRRDRTPVRELESRIAHQEPVRGFARIIRERAALMRPAVIAEIKKASPSQGVIRERFDPAAIAASYERSGAACLSVLTDAGFFQGAGEHLQAARAAAALPALRKDFIIDPWQVYESRALGADCILLIVSILAPERLRELHDLALGLGLDVLVEAHDAAELETALGLAPALVGINNRNLKTFAVDLNTTVNLLPGVPQGLPVITESGIHRREDVARMLSHRVYGFLVGEAFMRAPDPGQALASLFDLPGH